MWDYETGFLVGVGVCGSGEGLRRELVLDIYLVLEMFLVREVDASAARMLGLRHYLEGSAYRTLFMEVSMTTVGCHHDL